MKVDQPVKIYTGVHIFCEEPGSLEWVIHGGDYVRDDIAIPGFVSFQKVKRAARTGRNPQTGATIKIPASATVKVTAGARLKSAVK